MLARKSAWLLLSLALSTLPAVALGQEPLGESADVDELDGLEEALARPAAEAEPVRQAVEAPAAPAVPEPVSSERHEEVGALRPGAEHPAVAHAGAEHHFEVMDFVATVVNFLIWLAIVVFLLRKPLMTHLQNRRLAVLEGIEQSKRLREAAEQKHAEYSERLKNLDRELAKLRQEMIQAGEAERDRIVAEAEARASRMRRDAQFLIDQQMKQLKTDLTREAIEAAISAAEEMLAKQTAGADQQRLADGYLGTLERVIEDGEVRA